jgi:hypothetical protein
VVTDPGGLGALLPSWWDLLERASDPQPVKTPLWALAWWSVFGGGRDLRILVLEAGGQVIGIVPLLRRWIRREGVIPVATLELIASGEDREDEIFSEYIGAIAAAGHEATVANELVRALCGPLLGDWDELRMPAMSGDDPMVPLLVEELRGHEIEATLETTHDCPFIELPRRWDDYLARLDGSKRYFVRRTLRDLEAWAGPDGAVLRRAEDADGLRHGRRILQSLHAERWSGGGVFHSARFRGFHDIVTEALLRGEGGTLDLLWLEVRGSPVAIIYNIVYKGRVHFYQSGRSLDVPKEVRAGIALHLYAIRRSIEMGYKSYDFLAKADQYKLKLAPSGSRRLVTLTATSPSVRGRASSNVRRTARLLIDLARGLSGAPPSTRRPDLGGESPASTRAPQSVRAPPSTRAPQSARPPQSSAPQTPRSPEPSAPAPTRSPASSEKPGSGGES